MIGKGDVKDAEAAFATRGVKVLASMLKILNVVLHAWMSQIVDDVTARMFVSGLKLSIVLDMLLEVIRKRVTVHRTTDNRLRFVTFLNHRRPDTMLASGDPCVAAHVVHVFRAEH